jgi:hypothetical protein
MGVKAHMDPCFTLISGWLIANVTKFTQNRIRQSSPAVLPKHCALSAAEMAPAMFKTQEICSRTGRNKNQSTYAQHCLVTGQGRQGAELCELNKISVRCSTTPATRTTRISGKMHDHVTCATEVQNCLLGCTAV